MQDFLYSLVNDGLRVHLLTFGAREHRLLQPRIVTVALDEHVPKVAFPGRKSDPILSIGCELSNHPRMIVRRLGPRDWCDAERFVVAAAFPPWHRPSGAELQDARVARWVSGWDEEVGFGVESTGGLVGAAWARIVEPLLFVNDDGAPLWELIIAIDEPFRGRGLGQQLVSDLQHLVASLSLPGLVLTVSERNSVALRLYRARGFAERDRTAAGQLIMTWLAG